MLSHHTWSPSTPLINVVAPRMPASEPKPKQSDVTTLNWGEGGMLVSSQWVWQDGCFFWRTRYYTILCRIMPYQYTNIYQPYHTTLYHLYYYMYIYVYIYYIYTHLYVDIYIHIHTYIHACMHAQYIQDISSHHISTKNSPYSDSISTSTILWISDWITPSPSMIHPPEAENLLRVAQGTSDRASCV